MIIYILQMSDGRYLNKDLDWTADIESKNLYKAQYRDIALNKLVELNAKNIDLRAKIVCCEVNSQGKPIPSSQCSAAA
jgi:hypothetical protein